MTIGGSIALIVIGAILRFAINWSPAFVDVRVVGLILMIGGAVGLVISLAFLVSRRRRDAVIDEPPTEVYEQRRYAEAPGQRRYNDPPIR
jgi:Domain of unknown function (DUF6458)